MASRRSWLRRLGGALLALVLGALLVSVGLVLAFRWVNPPVSAFMVEDTLGAWIEREPGYQLRHEWADLEQISPHLALAVLAGEDQKFPEHFGFDIEAIEKAYERNQHSKRIRGASTISQQVAKNVFLWSGRSYFRKGLEAWFTVLIETFWPKRRILEMYLNVAEFGRGIYGAQAASRVFFHRDAARLARSEAALLAAVLPNPRLYKVNAPSAYVLRRRDWILGQMSDLGGPETLGEIHAYPHKKRNYRH
jgi:monofunctional glycosyltransferase